MTFPNASRPLPSFPHVISPPPSGTPSAFGFAWLFCVFPGDRDIWGGGRGEGEGCGFPKPEPGVPVYLFSFIFFFWRGEEPV